MSTETTVRCDRMGCRRHKRAIVYDSGRRRDVVLPIGWVGDRSAIGKHYCSQECFDKAKAAKPAPRPIPKSRRRA